uniref:Ig-like domain-containing protein n=1 Tax=Pundamilia nyererei TaxID=303518 RepID=A0A3B4HCT8_9CICH
MSVVYNFFPNKIKVSWLRDGQEVNSDVTSTEVMPNGDWYYQTHSHLVYKPRSGEKISCVVEHASLSEPLITDWGTLISGRHRCRGRPPARGRLCYRHLPSARSAFGFPPQVSLPLVFTWPAP